MRSHHCCGAKTPKPAGSARDYKDITPKSKCWRDPVFSRARFLKNKRTTMTIHYELPDVTLDPLEVEFEARNARNAYMAVLIGQAVAWVKSHLHLPHLPGVAAH